MARSRIDRRRLLAGLVLAGAASATSGRAKAATSPIIEKAPRPSALRSSAAVAAAETGTPQISNGDLQDIYAYLQSIPKPPDAKTIPLLNP
jgi:hypothetical protein